MSNYLQLNSSKYYFNDSDELVSILNNFKINNKNFYFNYHSKNGMYIDIYYSHASNSLKYSTYEMNTYVKYIENETNITLFEDDVNISLTIFLLKVIKEIKILKILNSV